MLNKRVALYDIHDKVVDRGYVEKRYSDGTYLVDFDEMGLKRVPKQFLKVVPNKMICKICKRRWYGISSTRKNGGNKIK